MSLAPPLAAAFALAARLLATEGFEAEAWNERRDTLYLRRSGSPFFLRLSNHARTAKQRRRRTDILTSLVLDRPCSPERLVALVRGAVRDFEANAARRP
ncbi:hypothetical protein [Methylobacterium aerolatum]|uniref:Uncharacterized protein n=1 Tax=Methylobacterium aerolatum TaxID=418708 RepID=A0ABU0HYD2_9HYPH|nr:hypothetical protein [Methylobacterium aerolatum]MDQ0447331.1 hypothetical protein [Methylobacterium aerolatum]GJD36995.1 hypothetical protein FMGBMHLM_3921 [Methylobacterium aerolatum]